MKYVMKILLITKLGEIIVLLLSDNLKKEPRERGRVAGRKRRQRRKREKMKKRGKRRRNGRGRKMMKKRRKKQVVITVWISIS